MSNSRYIIVRLPNFDSVKPIATIIIKLGCFHVSQTWSTFLNSLTKQYKLQILPQIFFWGLSFTWLWLLITVLDRTLHNYFYF